MITRSNITNRLKLLGTLLDHHYKLNGYKYDSNSEWNPYRVSALQMYSLLQLETCCDLQRRLEAMQKEVRKEEPLTTRTRLLKYNYIDVIMEDENLKAAAMNILDSLIKRYQADQFQVIVNLNEDNDLLEDFL